MAKIKFSLSQRAAHKTKDPLGTATEEDILFEVFAHTAERWGGGEKTLHATSIVPRHAAKHFDILLLQFLTWHPMTGKCSGSTQTNHDCSQAQHKYYVRWYAARRTTSLSPFGGWVCVNHLRPPSGLWKNLNRPAISPQQHSARLWPNQRPLLNGHMKLSWRLQ